MAVPTLNVIIDFSSGASYGIPMVLGTGQIGYNVLADADSVIVDVSDQAIETVINRGRNLTQDQYEAGTASVKVLDPNGDFNPQNSSSPYAGLLVPMRKLRLSATHLGVTYPVFSGYIQGFNYTYPRGQEIGYVTLVATDGFRLFQGAAITTVSTASAGQNTGQRITSILDEIGFPAGMRSIQSGDTTCQADSGSNRSALQAFRDAEFSEMGAFYCDANGNAVFKNRSYVVSSYGAAPTVFNQTTGINYANLVFALDDKLIYNEANFTRTGGTKQSVSNADSIALYFTHSYTKENLIMQTDAEALNLATSFVASRKDTTIRIDAMTLDLYTPSYSAGIIAALSLDYFSNVQITNDQQGGSTITKFLQVQGINHQITPTTWKTTFATAEPILDGFILDSTVSGIIGTSVFSY